MLTLLDTTLRDGSYVVDFQFTAMDTALIAGALDACGVPFIEVGHGIGLRAGTLAASRAACTDREYADAAARAVVRGRWGMFCIPGIALLEDVDLLADAGAGFVRIGTNVTNVADAAPFIARAKARGLWVAANFMKTYALSPDDVGIEARRAAEFGADLVCIVDSAGGMLPDDVAAYADAIRHATSVPFGFHGHDNLGLAVANTLRAVDAGASMIDTSLRGMGRSAGNACTEMVLFALQRQQIDLGIDPIAMLSIAERRIDPMLRTHQSRDSIGIVSGFAQFHSSFLDRVYDAAERHHVDARELIIAVTADDKVNAPAALVERHASRLAERGVQAPSLPSTLPTSRPSFTGALEMDAELVAREAHSLARRRGKRTVFNIVQAWREPDRSMVFRSVHEGSQFVVASAEAASAHDAARLASAVQAHVDTLLVDADHKSDASADILAAVRAAVTRDVDVLHYSDLDAWARSIAHLVVSRDDGIDAHTDVRLLIGDARTAPLGALVQILLEMRGVRVHTSPTKAATLLVCCAPLGAEHAAAWMTGITRVIDGWVGALPATALQHAHVAGVTVQRVDMRVVMHAEMMVARGMHDLLATSRGSGTLDGVAVAAGGIVPPRGTVIVDSVDVPSRVFGVADGRGLLVPSGDLAADEERAVQTVERRVALVGV